MTEAIRRVVDGDLAGTRLDRAVAAVAGCSRAEAAHLVEAGRVRVQGAAARARAQRLVEGEVLEVSPEERSTEVPTPDPDVGLAVRHVDDDIIVVDKPAGLVVHPGAGRPGGTLVNGLLARFPELGSVGDPERPGIVHRLDRGTSGLLVVARTSGAHASLVEQLAAREVTREYEALVWGTVADPRGLVDAPIGRSRRDPTRMAVTADGREARTGYERLGTWRSPAEVSLLRCRLETGRTHQVRVHLRAIGHPVVGDDRYGGARSSLPLDRLFLHACHLELTHPETGARLVFDSSLPDELVAVLEQLEA